MLSQTYVPLFPIELAAKDRAYACAVAGAAGAHAPLGVAMHEVLTRAVAAGLGAEYLTALRKLYP